MNEQKKPKCQLTGEDGNVFNLIGIASRCLKRSGQPEKAKEMGEKIKSAGSYDEALNIIGQYVDVS